MFEQFMSEFVAMDRANNSLILARQFLISAEARLPL
jgi:hypothetical protein